MTMLFKINETGHISCGKFFKYKIPSSTLTKDSSDANYLKNSGSGSSHLGADFAPHDDLGFTSAIKKKTLRVATKTNHKMAVL